MGAEHTAAHLERPRKHSSAWAEGVLAAVVLGLSLLYSVRSGKGHEVTLGFLGAFSSPAIVSSAPPCSAPSPDECVADGDEVLAIDGVPLDELRHSRTRSVFSLLRPGDTVPLLLRRGDRTIEVDVLAKASEPSWTRGLVVALGPLSFWLAGTAALLFVRPRGELRTVVVSLAYDTALWVASGAASASRFGGSAVVFHLTIWFFLPLVVHLHLIVPSDLLARRWQAPILITLYSGATVLAIADTLRLVEPLAMNTAFFGLTTLLVAVGLLSWRAIVDRRKSTRRMLALMASGLLLGLGPMVVFFASWSVVTRTPSIPLFQLCFVTLPLLPFAYALSVASRSGAWLRVRANRLFTVYAFWAVAATVLVPAIVLLEQALENRYGRDGASALYPAVALCAGSGVLLALAFPRFKRLVDRKLIGVHWETTDVLTLAARRIATAFDRRALQRVLSEDILPALLVRESALIWTGYAGRREILAHGVRDPQGRVLEGILRSSEEARMLEISEIAEQLPWVRLGLPLTVRGRNCGVWLLGRRDPDDDYSPADKVLLQAVGNQIAQMLEHIGLVEDARAEVAQRRAAEETARQREARFQALFESTLEGIAIVRDETIVEVNSALAQLLGTTPEVLIGMPVSQVVPARQPAGGDATATQDLPAIRPDGGTVQVELAQRRHQLLGEEVTVLAVRNIEERRRREQEYRALERQLHLAQKMEAMGRLSAGVAHDFNNCLQAVLSYADLLLARYPSTPLLSHSLEGLREAVLQGAGLSRQLLAFARRQPVEPILVDLNAIVAGLEKMLRRLLPEDIGIVTELHPEVPRVRFDPVQLEQVLVNLAVNSRDAMPQGGRFLIQTFPVQVEAGGRDHGPPPGEYALLTVSDTGVGMSTETLQRAFEPFFTTRREGSGLGLSIVYGLIEQAGGTITVESQPGRGTHFLIYLPAMQGEAVAPAAEPLPAASRGWEQVLLVEDNEHVRSSLSTVLRNQGYRVVDAASAEEALLLAQDESLEVAALVTDLTMPGMSGTELAEALTRVRADLAIIFMSGYSEREVPSLRSERSAWLQKPFRPELMTATLRQLLDRVTR